MEENLFETQQSPEFMQVAATVQSIRAELSKVIIGQHKMIDLLIAGLFAGGHILIEGVPALQKR